MTAVTSHQHLPKLIYEMPPGCAKDLVFQLCGHSDRLSSHHAINMWVLSSIFFTNKHVYKNSVWPLLLRLLQHRFILAVIFLLGLTEHLQKMTSMQLVHWRKANLPMLTMKMTFFYFLVLNQFLMSHFSQGSKLEKQCSTQENTREFLEETITPLLTSRETVYVMGTLKHSFLSEIIQEWHVGLSLLLFQCLVSMYAKAMKVWETQ